MRMWTHASARDAGSPGLATRAMFALSRLLTPMRKRSVAVRSALLTVRDLVGGLIAAVGLGALIAAAGKSFPRAAQVIAVLVAGAVLVKSVRIWANDIFRLGGSPSATTARIAVLGLVPAVIAVGLALSALEPTLVARGAQNGLAIHVVYVLVFVPATLLVAAVGAFGLGAAMRSAAFGFRLASVAGLAAAVGFSAVAIAMDAIGWRVGAPDAGRRATMIVVTALGMVGAAFAAGGAIGLALPRSPASEE
jgi:hypothetical protein